MKAFFTLIIKLTLCWKERFQNICNCCLQFRSFHLKVVNMLLGFRPIFMQFKVSISRNDHSFWGTLFMDNLFRFKNGCHTKPSMASEFNISQTGSIAKKIITSILQNTQWKNLLFLIKFNFGFHCKNLRQFF